jgi:hypothetical protein
MMMISSRRGPLPSMPRRWNEMLPRIFPLVGFVRFRGDRPPSSSDLWDEEFVPTHDPRRLVVKPMENCFLPNRAWAVRREAQMRVGPYDESMYYSHDYDMILRLARTNEGVFIDDPVLYQRKHLSYRRPSAERTFILDTVGKWVKHDALLFNKLDREWSLSDFRPFPDKGALDTPRGLGATSEGRHLVPAKSLRRSNTILWS